MKKLIFEPLLVLVLPQLLLFGLFEIMFNVYPWSGVHAANWRIAYGIFAIIAFLITVPIAAHLIYDFNGRGGLLREFYHEQERKAFEKQRRKEQLEKELGIPNVSEFRR